MRMLCGLASLWLAAFITTTTASGLDIRIAPQTLVLSSSGGHLTVHTDVPIIEVVDESVLLEVEGTAVACNTFADSLGNLVAQCSKEAAKEAIGEFESKRTTATVTLTVLGETASAGITVKK